MVSNGLLRPRERADYGLTVTLCTPEGGQWETRTYPGHVTPALRDLAAHCDEKGLRVLCISTPNTILSDIRGRGSLPTPEESILGRIGRTDLIYR